MDFSNLPNLDPTSYGTLDAELRQPWAAYESTVYGKHLDVDASCRVVTPIQRVVDATAIASMQTAIGALPAPDESIHLWIGGKHSMGHVIAAVLALAAPAVIEHVSVATLTFSKDNADEWASFIDARQIKSMKVVTSVYFDKTSPGIFTYAQSILEPRGVEIITLRCHAKLAVMRLSDGRTIAAEGSANTRSSKTIEQVTIFGSPAIYEFHFNQINRAEKMKGIELKGQKEEE